MPAERAGFTLVELLVALSIGAVVLVGARTLLDGLSWHAAATARVARELDGSANGEHVTRLVVGNVALAPALEPTFTGTPDESAFASWCPSARGGLEWCRVRLLVRQTGMEREVILSLSTGQEYTVRRGAEARLRYLADAAEGGRWYAQWGALLSPPLAIGVLTESDTLLLRIGERR
jgi:prepilin-type N-terminal cleavage/methylation domain-containing protein